MSRTSAILCVIIAAIFFVPFAGLFGQEDEYFEKESEFSELTFEDYSQLSEEYGIATDSPAMDRILERISGDLNPQEISAINKSKFTSLTKGVVKHIRGDGGVSFSTQTQTDMSLTQEKLNQLGNAYIAGMDNVIRNGPKAPKLPKCIEHKTFAMKAQGIKKRIQAESVFLDMLFVDHELSENIDRVYGQSVQAHRYLSGTQDPYSVMAIRLGVHCLPYRIRVTNNNIYKIFGDNALKNYEAIQHKKIVPSNRQAKNRRNG